jgi:molybdopterin synthase catalytic subunit
MKFCEISISDKPLDVPPAQETLRACGAMQVKRGPDAPFEETQLHSCGAVVDFFGAVRSIENGRIITGIDYESHPRMAWKELNAIVAEAARNPELHACILMHRVGFVPAGEVSLFLRVAAPHRGAAYELSREIVEQLKRRAPIWKRPIFTEAALLPPSA